MNTDKFPDISSVRKTNLRRLEIEAGGRKHLAEKMDVHYSQITNVLAKKASRNIGNNMARKAEFAMGKPSGWLDRMEGYTFAVLDAPLEPTDSTSSSIRDTIIAQFESPSLTTEVDQGDKIWVDLDDVKFSCGPGESIEFHFETIEKRKLAFDPSFFITRKVNPKNARFARAKGDSMEEYIGHGDMFGMDISDTEPRDGEIYAIYFEGEAMLKQIFKEAGGKLVLHSKNPKYRDRIVDEDNGASFFIIGRQFFRSG